MLYVDTSAFLKLLVPEDHTDVLRARLDSLDIWSSTLLAVEAHRAAMRLGVSGSSVDDLLRSVSLVLPDEATFFLARTIGRAELRSLDALHLACASELGDDLEGLVTYDQRLASSTATMGFVVVSPGRPDQWWVNAG